MNVLTRWIAYWNRKVRRMTIVDLKLVQVGSMALILTVAKLVPRIMDLSIWWFVALVVVCMWRPLYIFWIQADDPGQQTA
jgi:hypothetical protein